MITNTLAPRMAPIPVAPPYPFVVLVVGVNGVRITSYNVCYTKLLRRADRSIIEEKKRQLERVEELHEINPMLGLRGCRLGIVYPEISRMQVRAIFEATCEVLREGIRAQIEVIRITSYNVCYTKLLR